MPLADSLQRATAGVESLALRLREARGEMRGLEDDTRSAAGAAVEIPDILRRSRGPAPPGTASGLGPQSGDVGPIRAQFQPASISPGGLVGPSGQPVGSGSGPAVGTGTGGGGGGLVGGLGIRPRGNPLGPAVARELLDQHCDYEPVDLPLRIGQTQPDTIMVWSCPWGAEYVDPESLPQSSTLSGGAGGAGGGTRAGSRRPRPGLRGLGETNPTAGLRETSEADSAARRAGAGRSVSGASVSSGERQIIGALGEVRRSVDRLRAPDPGASLTGRV